MQKVFPFHRFVYKPCHIFDKIRESFKTVSFFAQNVNQITYLKHTVKILHLKLGY